MSPFYYKKMSFNQKRRNLTTFFSDWRCFGLTMLRTDELFVKKKKKKKEKEKRKKETNKKVFFFVSIENSLFLNGGF